MAIMSIDYKLRYIHFILVFLISCLVVLGFYYLNETSQRIQLQQQLAFLERHAKHIVAERSIIEERSTNLQEQLKKQKIEIRNIQDKHELLLEEQNAIYWNEKNDLLKDISLKDETIQDKNNQYEMLKKRFDNLHSEMEEFEKNQSRLLEKFSTQSTQCMSTITMIKQLCDEKRDSTLRKISKPTTEKKTIFLGIPLSPQIYASINETSTKSVTLSSRINYNINATTVSSKDSGDQDSTTTRGTSETISKMLTSQKANPNQNVMQKSQSLQTENNMTKSMQESNKTKQNEEIMGFRLDKRVLRPENETRKKEQESLETKNNKNNKALPSEKQMQLTIKKETDYEMFTNEDDKQIPNQEKNITLKPQFEALEVMNKSGKMKDTKSYLEKNELEGNKTEPTDLEMEGIQQINETSKDRNDNLSVNMKNIQTEAEKLVNSNNNLDLDKEIDINNRMDYDDDDDDDYDPKYEFPNIQK